MKSCLSRRSWVPWEQASEIVAELGRLAAAGTSDARDAINRGLAQRAGLPVPTIAASVLGGPFAEVSGPLVVRTPATQVRISGGRFGSFTLHLPSGDEVGRGDEQTAVGVAEAVAGVESGESTERIAALFEVSAAASIRFAPSRASPSRSLGSSPFWLLN